MVLFADLDVLVHVIEFGLHILENAGAARRNIRSDILKIASCLSPKKKVTRIKVIFSRKSTIIVQATIDLIDFQRIWTAHCTTYHKDRVSDQRSEQHSNYRFLWNNLGK